MSQSAELFARIASGARELDPAALERRLAGPLERTVAYLASDAALADSRRDPYWPKWSTPWWHMTLLLELGLERHIPQRALSVLLDALRGHFIHFFPTRWENVPAGVDARRHIICHCAFGTVWQVLDACGVDVEAELPWVRSWVARYRLPDGGLNCDESAYLRTPPRSSMVSTVPPAEALIRLKRNLSEEETQLLSGVADYLQRRSLFRSLSRGGRPIDPDWLTPAFPRFYFYDALRGLRWLADWSARSGAAVSWEAIAEVVGELTTWFEQPDDAAPPRHVHKGPTLTADASGAWVSAPAQRFPLLDAAAQPDVARAVLRSEWQRAVAKLASPGALD